MSRDLLDTHVEVTDDGDTVVLWIDGHALRFTAEDGEARHHVDVLRRISAAADRALRLLRDAEARTAALHPPSPPNWL